MNQIFESFNSFQDNLILEAFQSSMLQDIFGKSDNKGKQMLQKLADKDGANIALNTITDRGMKHQLWTNTGNAGEYIGNYKMKDIADFDKNGSWMSNNTGATSETITIFTINDNIVAIVQKGDYDEKKPFKVIANNVKGVKRKDLAGLLAKMNVGGMVAYTFRYGAFNDDAASSRSKVSGAKTYVPTAITLTQGEKLELYKGMKLGDVGILTLYKSIAAESSGDRIDSNSFRKQIAAMAKTLTDEVNKLELNGSKLNFKAGDIKIGVDGGDDIYIRLDFNKNNNSLMSGYYDSNDNGYHEGIVSACISDPKKKFTQVNCTMLYGSSTSNWFPSYDISFYDASGMKTKKKYAGEIKKFMKKIGRVDTVKGIVKYIKDNKSRDLGASYMFSDSDKRWAAAKPYTEALKTVIEKILGRQEEALEIYDYRKRHSLSSYTEVRPYGGSSKKAGFTVNASYSAKGKKLVKKSMKVIVAELNDILGAASVTGKGNELTIHINMKVSDLTE